MNLRQAWSWMLVIILVEGLVGQRQVAAQSESIRLQRIFVPQGQIGEVVPRDYMPMSIDEMEGLIEAAESSQSGLRTDRPRLVAARYTASLFGQSLVSSNSRWELVYNDDSPGYFVVSPLNLSIAPQVDSLDNLGLKSFRPEAKSKAEASEPWMVDSQGTVSLPVNESGSFTFGWSSYGTRDSNGELHFRLSVPNAPRSCLLLRLPSGYSIGRCSAVVVRVPITSLTLQTNNESPLSEAQIGSSGVLPNDEASGSLIDHSPWDDKALSFEKNLRELFVMSGFYELSQRDNAAFPIDLVDSQSSFWLIEFGGDSQLALDLVPPRSQDRTAWNEVISNMNSSYEATSAGLQIQTRIEAGLREEASQLDLELQGGLRVREVRIDGQPTNWQLLPDAAPVIRIPLPFRTGATRTVQVQVNCVAPALTEISSPLPCLVPREAMVLRGEGTLIFTEPLTPGVGVGKACELRPMASTASQRSPGWEWSWAGRVPSLEFSASRNSRVLEVRTLSRLTFLPGSIDATIWIRIPVVGTAPIDSSFLVSEGWIIDALTTSDKAVDYETSVEPEGTRVTLRLSPELTGGPSTQPERYQILELVAHRALDSDDTNVAIPEFQLIRFRDSKQLDTYIVDPLSRFVVEPSSEILRMRIKDDALQDWQRALLPRLSNSWLLQAGNQPLPSLTFSKQPATFSAQVSVTASLHNTELEETYSVKCRPLSGSLDRVVVRFTRSRDAALRWQIQQGDQEVFLQAERVLSSDGLSEEYRIQLPKAVTDTVELRSARWSAWQDLLDLSVPIVELVSTQEIEVRVSSPLSLHESAAASVDSITRRVSDRDTDRSEEYRLVGSWGESPLKLTLREDVAASQWAPHVFHQRWYFSDGRVLHQSTYAIENNGRIQIKLALPKDAELDSILLDGTPITAKLRAQKNEFQIEQVTDRQHSKLAVRYRSNSQPLTFINHIEFEEPIVNLPILESRTVVWLPSNYVNLNEFVNQLSNAPTGWRFAKARFWEWVLLGRQPIPVSLLRDLGDWDPLEEDFVASPVDNRLGDLNSSPESSTASWLQWRKMNGISWVPITRGDGIRTFHSPAQERSEDTSEPERLRSSGFSRTVWDLRQLRIWFLTGWIVVLMLSIGAWRFIPMISASLDVTAMVLSFYADPMISVFSFAVWSALTFGGFVYAVQKGMNRLQNAESPSVPDWQFLSASKSKANPAIIFLALGLSILLSATAKAQEDKVYGVVIPIDSQGEVPGQYVYVPIEAYDKLTRASQASPTATSSFVYRSARYAFTPYANAEMMGGPSGQLTAEFEIDVREPATPIFWPIGTDAAKLDRLIVNSQEIIPGFTVRQDDTGVRWQSERTGVIKVKLVLIPKSTLQDEWSSFRVPIPPIPTAQVELIGADNFVFRCDSSDGERVDFNFESQLAIGPLRELRIRWRGRESRSPENGKAIRFTSDSWVHLDRNDTFALTRLQGTGSTALPMQYSLLMDSRWQPVGSDWGGVRWSGVSETASAGINRYNVSRVIEQGAPPEIVIVWRLKRADSIAEGAAIPFATIESGNVASRTCTWSASTDTPWQVQFPENWQLQPVEFVGATWSKSSPTRARAIAIETGNGRLPTLTRAAAATSLSVGEVNEIHIHRRSMEIAFQASWQGRPPKDQLQLLIPAGAVLGEIKLNGTPAVYHRSNRSATSDLLSIAIDSDVTAINTLEVAAQIEFTSGQSKNLPRIFLIDVDTSSSVIEVYRDLEVELTVEANPEMVESELPRYESVKNERLEVALGRYQLPSKFRQEAEVPLSLRIVENEHRSDLMFMTETARANERWLVTHRVRKNIGSEWPAAMVFAVTTQSGTAQLGSDFQVEPKLPVRVETSPDGSLYYVIVAMDPSQKIGESLELQFEVTPPSTSPFQVPEIRFLGRGKTRQFLVVPTLSESKSIDWLVSGIRPISVEESQSLGISEDDSKAKTTYLVDAPRYQAIQQTRATNESVKPIPLVSHVVVSANDEQWKAQSDFFLASVGRLWFEFEVPEDVVVLGVQIGLETVQTTRNGNIIAVPVSPSDLPACVRVFSAGKFHPNGLERELNLVKPRNLEVEHSNVLFVSSEPSVTARSGNREMGEIENVQTFLRDRIGAVIEVVTDVLKSPGATSRLELASWYKPWRRSIHADVRLLESVALQLPSDDPRANVEGIDAILDGQSDFDNADRVIGEQQIAKVTLDTLRAAEEKWIASLADESIDTLKDASGELVTANLLSSVSAGKHLVLNVVGSLDKIVLKSDHVETPSLSSDWVWMIVSLLLGLFSALVLSTWLRSPILAATRSPALLLAAMGVFLAIFLPVWQIGGVVIVVASCIGLGQTIRGMKHRRRFSVRSASISRSPSR